MPASQHVCSTGMYARRQLQQQASTAQSRVARNTERQSHTGSEVCLPGAASAWMPSSMFANRFASMVSRRRFFPCSPLLAVSWPTATKVFARTCTQADCFTAAQHLVLIGAQHVVSACILDKRSTLLRASPLIRHGLGSLREGSQWALTQPSSGPGRHAHRLGRLFGALIGVQNIVVVGGRELVHGVGDHVVDADHVPHVLQAQARVRPCGISNTSSSNSLLIQERDVETASLDADHGLHRAPLS